MERIHAFGDDALGDLDAVGLVEKLRAGEVSASEVVEAAIARTEAVNPKRNGLAFEAFDRARARASSRRPYGGYDAVLMPTLNEATPRIGHLDPTAGYDQVMDRLLEWVSFTPLQNASGDPAISLPLGESASGLPVGMMLSTVAGQEARLLELAYELEEARPWARIQS